MLPVGVAREVEFGQTGGWRPNIPGPGIGVTEPRIVAQTQNVSGSERVDKRLSESHVGQGLDDLTVLNDNVPLRVSPVTSTVSGSRHRQ